jgi:exodeoxyribonuclease VII small subunit
MPAEKLTTNHWITTMAKGKPQDLSFEAGLKRLEEVLDSLEHGNLSLEEAMRAFEEGVQLVRLCHQKLDAVEKRVELLLKDDAGRFFTRPFPEEEGEG